MQKHYTTITQAANSTAQTTTGDNVVVQVGDTSVTFKRVTVNGITTLTPVNPPSAQDLLAFGYANAKASFKISTTAQVTPPVDVCYQLATDADFKTATVMLALVGGKLKNVTTRTDAATRTVCGRITQFPPKSAPNGGSNDSGNTYDPLDETGDFGTFVIAEATNTVALNSATVSVSEAQCQRSGGHRVSDGDARGRHSARRSSPFKTMTRRTKSQTRTPIIASSHVNNT